MHPKFEYMAHRLNAATGHEKIALLDDADFF